MKHALLIALLGATVTLATPTLSYADNGFKFQSKALDRDHQYKHKHGHKHHHHKAKVKNDRRVDKSRSHNKSSQFVYNSQGYDRNGYNKYGYNRHGFNKQGFNKSGFNRQGYNKQGYNRHGYNKHKQHYSYQNSRTNKPSFSISWNLGNSTVSYGNGHNQAYVNQPKKYRGKRIHSRLNNQANRIQQGINKGQLVHREISKLRHEQRHIKNTLSHYKRDGHLNRYERNKLNQLLDVASQNIHRKSNNRKTRYAQKRSNQYNKHNFYVQF